MFVHVASSFSRTGGVAVFSENPAAVESGVAEFSENPAAVKFLTTAELSENPAAVKIHDRRRFLSY